MVYDSYEEDEREEYESLFEVLKVNLLIIVCYLIISIYSISVGVNKETFIVIILLSLIPISNYIYLLKEYIKNMKIINYKISSSELTKTIINIHRNITFNILLFVCSIIFIII